MTMTAFAKSTDALIIERRTTVARLHKDSAFIGNPCLRIRRSSPDGFMVQITNGVSLATIDYLDLDHCRAMIEQLKKIEEEMTR